MKSFMNMIALSGAMVAVQIFMPTVGANANPIGSIRDGRRLAHAACAQCHRVDKTEFSTNPAAPAFENIANVPGMTTTALTVALRTSHRSMPNL